ncbi:MAG: radical SAM protein, partial [Lachnospiraceae bacterium]|nr:radical SAM protein [Lachnospiraceae bacterium]
ITIEGNPDSLTTERLLTYRALGINRLSIGLQSANDDILKMLGRVHNDVQFLAAYEDARKAGFSNINVDIMSGLPGEDRDSYIRTLEQVLQLCPEHISAYSLMVEEGTPLAQNKLLLSKIPGEEEDRQRYVLTKELLQQYGYERYEISNYAKPGSACRHNIVYWTGGEYLGVGLGAASCLTFYGTGRKRQKVRFRGTERMEMYMKYFCSGNRIPEKETVTSMFPEEDFENKESFLHFLTNTCEEFSFLTQKDEMEEFMFLGLRMMQGISRTEFRERFRVELESVYGPVLQTYRENGLLLEWDDRLFLSDRGIDVSNVVMADFFL